MAYYECECDNFDMTEGQDSFEMNEGIPGPGVPAGGSAGQVLRKTTSADYDTEWDTLDAGEIPYSGSTSYPNNTVGSKVYELDSGVNSLWNYAVQANTKASNALDNEATAYNYHLQYHVGDYCLYQQKLYRCIVETPAAGEMWNSSHWTAVTVGDEMIETASDISVLRNTLNHKADLIYDTASGDIASFSDGADGLPVKDLTVAIEPVQDLHGYENPWPGGGGKNILNPHFYSGGAYNPSVGDTWTLTDSSVQPTANADNSVFTFTTSATWRYYTLLIPVVRGTDYRFTGSISSTGHLGVSIGYLNDEYKVIQASGNNTSTSQTWNYAPSPSTEGTAAYYFIVITNRDTASATITITKPQFEEGSTATAYAPYSNICPISGRTGANVIGVGEALSGFEQGALNSNGMNSTSDTRIRTKNYIPVVPGKTYYIHAFPTVSGKITQVYIYFYNKADYSTNKKDRIGWLQLPTTFTVPNNSMYIRFVLSYVSGENVNPSNFNPVFLWPNNEKTSVSISWQSEAGTVYGGTLDVTTGVLTVDRAYVQKAWSEFTNQSSGDGYKEGRIYGLGILNAKRSHTICDKLKYDANNTNSSFYVSSSSTNTGYIRAFVPIETGDDETFSFAYHIATPQTYQLTPEEVTTLLGQNNIWADCGSSTVEYPADTKLYIQKINTPTDDDMIADANIASGKYFIVNNNLYLSTAAILAGDPIKPGTNCTLTNLAAALNALNS